MSEGWHLGARPVDIYIHATSLCIYIYNQQNPGGKKQQGPDMTELLFVFLVCLGCEVLHVNQIEFAGKVIP